MKPACLRRVVFRYFARNSNVSMVFVVAFLFTYFACLMSTLWLVVSTLTIFCSFNSLVNTVAIGEPIRWNSAFSSNSLIALMISLACWMQVSGCVLHLMFEPSTRALLMCCGMP